MLSLVTFTMAFVANLIVANGQSCSTPSGSGTCRYTTDCPNAGGTSVAGYCPGATNYQCCVPKSCSTPSGSGKCKPISECSGTKVAGYCPGPSTTQCCITSSGGSCTLSNPTTAQSKSACTNRAVDTGSQCWTNRAYTLYQRIQACYPNIECTTYYTAPGSGSDHNGNALDCWSKRGRPCPATGTTQTELQTLANWGKNNAVALKIGFINWRQQMWSQGRASEGWRSYASRGTCTDNHYDHVHFSVCAGSYNEASYGC